MIYGIRENAMCVVKIINTKGSIFNRYGREDKCGNIIYYLDVTFYNMVKFIYNP